MRGILIAGAAGAALFIAMCSGSGDTSTTAATRYDIEAVMAAIDSGNSQWRRGTLSGNVDSLLAVYDDEPRSLSSSGNVIVGRDSLRAGFERFYGSYEVLDVYVTTQNVWLEGDNAWEKGVYGMMVVTPKGDTVSLQEQYLARWRYQPGGTWKTHMTITFPFVQRGAWPE